MKERPSLYFFFKHSWDDIRIARPSEGRLARKLMLLASLCVLITKSSGFFVCLTFTFKITRVKVSADGMRVTCKKHKICCNITWKDLRLVCIHVPFDETSFS